MGVSKDTNTFYDAESALWMSWARTTSSKSSSRSMSVRHEQGVSPFPLSQCWNTARQQATGLAGYSALISASFELVLSKSSWSPILCQNGATLSMILIFLPWGVRSRRNFARVGLGSKCKIVYNTYMFGVKLRILFDRWQLATDLDLRCHLWLK